MELLGRVMGALIKLCYGLVGNYLLAIALFTLLTKVILFPVSLWTHRNGIKMVELMPPLDRLKISHYGDKDAIAEGTQALYKEKGYHPLASLVPLFIQLVLLMGVIGAVRQMLAGTDSSLALTPSETGGWTLIMPLLAGLAALALGLAQNRINPLQREQTKAGKWMTNGLSIGISLALGAFVPVGVGFYWICSNLFTILQQLALNAVIPAERYVDYEALKEAKRELVEIESLSVNISPEDKRREKADYKRFFHVVNKHLVFYSESSGFYKYFQNVIEYLLDHSNIIIHYITSDPKDQIFDIAAAQPRIRPYYIGEKRLITLFMKMDADMVVMTVPDLDNFYLKRSYVRKDVEYVYMFHGIFVGVETTRRGSLDHYDTLLTVDPGAEEELRSYNRMYGVPDQKMVPCGYGVVDRMAAEYERMDKHENPVKTVLIAPSWQEGNVLESCLSDLAEPLLAAGYDVTVRPHPQYIRRFPQQLQKIMAGCEGYDKERFRFQLDFSSNETVYMADVLVTDWSSIGYEYALSTKKPVLHINTPRKRVFTEWSDEDIARFGANKDLRSVVGVALEPAQVRERCRAVTDDLVTNREKWAAQIETIRRERLYHFGESGKYGARYILGRLAGGGREETETNAEKM